MENCKKQVARSFWQTTSCRRNANHRRRSFGANAVKVDVVVIVVVTIIVATLALLSSSKLGALVEARRVHSVSAQFDSMESLVDEDSLSLPIASPIAAASSSLSGSVQCEPISIGLCSQMAYQTTRMPNFFHDTNQIEALDRAHQYTELVKSRCSAHVHAYVCELLTPVCLEESREAMRRFEIYPCRSFCRKVKRDCEHELIKLNERLFSEGSSSLLPGFACDLLPFESNGGNGTLRGPCHETPDSPQSPPQTHLQQQQHHSQQHAESNRGRQGGDSYRPYQPALETNVPPFITDITPLDPGAVRPVSVVAPSGSLLPQQQLDGSDIGQQQQATAAVDGGAGAGAGSNNMRRQQMATNRQQLMQPAHVNQPGGLGVQIANFAQNVFFTLSKYSNYLSILTLICLLIALSSKRLRYLTNYLRFSSPIGGASDGKSCSSSSSSQRQLTSNNSRKHGVHSSSIGNGYHQTLVGAKLGMAGVSPSSSSRSLMLIAGSNNGKQPPSHKLLPVELSSDECEPQKQLLHALGSNKTLINVNANSKNNITTTLDRQHHSRYLLLQAAAARQQHQQQQPQFKQHPNQHHNHHHHSLSLRQTNQHQFGASDTQQLFGTLDSESSQSNHYDYIELPAEQAAREQQHRLQQQHSRQQQLYSNILLSSPSHQVLLFNSQQQQQRQQQEALQARLAAAQLGSQSPQIGSSSSASSSSRAAYKHTQNT